MNKIDINQFFSTKVYRAENVTKPENNLQFINEKMNQFYQYMPYLFVNLAANILTLMLLLFLFLIFIVHRKLRMRSRNRQRRIYNRKREELESIELNASNY